VIVYTRVLKYLVDNGKSAEDAEALFRNMTIELVDHMDGAGPRILRWDVAAVGMPTPAEEQLPSSEVAENWFRTLRDGRKETARKVRKELEKRFTGWGDKEFAALAALMRAGGDPERVD